MITPLQQAAMKLEHRHYEWILSSAHDNLQEKLAETEADILRMEAFPTLPMFKGVGRKDNQREDKLAQLKGYQTQYLDCLHYVQELRLDLMENMPVDGIAEFLRGRAKPAPKPAPKKKAKK